MLSRNHPTIEGRKKARRALRREGHFVGRQDGERRHGRQTPRFTFEGNDLIAEREAARFFRNRPRVRVLPVKLLHRKLIRGLTLLYLFTRKDSVAWKNGL